MKRTISFILIFALCLSLCACTQDSAGTVTTDSESSAATGSSLTTTPATESSDDHTTEPASKPTTEPPHVHSFSAATCTAPKTCSCGATEGTANGHTWNPATCTAPKTCSCGATEGSANGHAWKSATCSEPKTCTVCRATSGLAAGHSFSGGKCTSCGKSDPDYISVTMVWIPTKGGTKYHTHAGCSNMIGPEHVTKAEAERRGFTPCKRCH